MNHYKIVLDIFMILWLFLCSLQDIKKKQISLKLILVGFVTLIIGSSFIYDISIWNRIAGLSLGFILIILNPITKGQIGIGDGLIVCCIGLCVGFLGNAMILITSLFISAAVSLYLLVVKRVKRNYTIPFIPFILIGYLGVIFI
ncbi:MAG: peptidase prepilin type [Anaerocolumna sp.]|nr:peptidase prepilin type [Anaerocolumna sp.]